MPDALLDSAVVSRAQHHPWCDLGHEIVVLRTRDNSYYRLETTGRSVWLLLEQPKTLGDLLVSLAREYEGDPTAVAADTRLFVSQCVELGLLQVEPSGV
jgi:hypothetical protein